MLEPAPYLSLSECLVLFSSIFRDFPLAFGSFLTHTHWSYSPDLCMSPGFSLCSVLHYLVRAYDSSHLDLSGVSAPFYSSKYPLPLWLLLLVSKPGAALGLSWLLLHLSGITIIVWSSVYLKLLFYLFFLILLLAISGIGRVNPVLALNYTIGEWGRQQHRLLIF